MIVMSSVNPAESLVQREPAGRHVGRILIHENKIQYVSPILFGRSLKDEYLSMRSECPAVVMCSFLQNCKYCLHYPVYYTGIGWVDVYFELNFALIEIFVKHCSSRAATDKLNFPRD